MTPGATSPAESSAVPRDDLPVIAPGSAAGSEYAQLSRVVRAAGLLRRRKGYYRIKISVNLLLLACGWTLFALIGRSWWQLLIAVGDRLHCRAGTARRGIGTWVARHQAWLFFPMLSLEAFHLHVAGVRTLMAQRGRAVKVTEASLLGVHIAGYLTAVFLVLSPVQAITFLLVQQGLFGVYLGCSFAPNHKGMPVLDEDDKLDFLRRQVITSRNIRGGWFTDFILGGLNYQIEHHLFPSMPRPSLRHAQAPVRAFCEEHGIAYRETGLVSSYDQVLRHLRVVGGTLRPDLEY